jgi:hypothetical protein
MEMEDHHITFKWCVSCPSRMGSLLSGTLLFEGEKVYVTPTIQGELLHPQTTKSEFLLLNFSNRSNNPLPKRFWTMVLLQ